MISMKSIIFKIMVLKVYFIFLNWSIFIVIVRQAKDETNYSVWNADNSQNHNYGFAHLIPK